MLVIIHLKFCPKRNVLAQVPSVHGSFRSACCLSSTPAALLCAAWELGLPRPVLNPRSAKQAICVVIGFDSWSSQVHCGAPHLGAVLGNSQAPGPTAALGWARGLDHARGPFRARGFDRARGPFPGARVRPRARLSLSAALRRVGCHVRAGCGAAGRGHLAGCHQ